MKIAPVSDAQVLAVAQEFPTPFYLYDEATIRDRVQQLQRAFAWNEGFREYFAVKALPNPAILGILHELGCGADCASATELMLAERVGMDHLMFTSNNTPAEEFVAARELGAIINVDAANLVYFLAQTAGVPETVCVRYTPDHEVGASNKIIGQTGESKFGMTREQVFWSLARLRELGARKFGIHCMAASNSLNQNYYRDLAVEMFDLAVEVKERLGIEISFLNMAGGVGIPYRPEDVTLDLEMAGKSVQVEYEARLTPVGLAPAIYTELGRYITGPAGVLVTRVLHLKSSYRDYVGVDASAVNLLRPAMYGSYHHITVVGRPAGAERVYDVVGSLCENNDKFAIGRSLPEVQEGDLLLIHDTGAHGYSMGYNYNGKLRCAEILLQVDGTARMIRRAETPEDYFATLNF